MGLLSETIAALRDAGARPRKALGQHFLVDDNIAALIVGLALAEPSEGMLEIGPGLGLLTARLAEKGTRLLAIEKDPLLARLAGKAVAGLPAAEVLAGDFLRADLQALLGRGKWTLVGNLPYSITAPIIFRALEERRHFSRMILMVQREVGQRMLAEPGGKEFGLLGILVQMYCRGRVAKVVSPNCFYPPPQVHSAIVELTVRQRPAVVVRDQRAFIAFCKRLFQQRRKQLLTILRRMLPRQSRTALSQVLREAGIRPEARPEQLPLASLARLYRALAAEVEQ